MKIYYTSHNEEDWKIYPDYRVVFQFLVPKGDEIVALKTLSFLSSEVNMPHYLVVDNKIKPLLAEYEPFELIQL